MYILNFFQAQLTPNVIEYLSYQIGEKDQRKVRFAANGVMQALLWQIANKAKNTPQTTALAGVLDRYNYEPLLYDAIGYWEGEKEPHNDKILDDKATVWHILGDESYEIVDKLVLGTGCNQKQIYLLLELLGPLVLAIIRDLKIKENLSIEEIAILSTKEFNAISGGNKGFFESFSEDALQKFKQQFHHFFNRFSSRPDLIESNDNIEDSREIKIEIKNTEIYDDSNPREVKLPNSIDLIEEGDATERFIDALDDLEEGHLTQKVYTGFSEINTPTIAIAPNQTLESNQNYYFWLEVSEEAIQNAIDVKATILKTALIPDAKKMTVAIFTLTNHFMLNPNADIGELAIGEKGKVSVLAQPLNNFSSTIPTDFTEKRLFFPLRTIQREGIYVLLCHIYYENILIQSHHVSAAVTANSLVKEHALVTELDYALTQTLTANDLKKHKKHQLSVLLQEDGGSHSFQFFGGRQFKNAADFDAQEIEHHLERIRGALRKAAWGKETPYNGEDYAYDKPVNPDKFAHDLIRLAKRGYQFYDTIIDRLSNGMLEELETSMKMPGYIQVALQNGARTVLPLAVLYDHPLDTGIDKKDITICEDFLFAIKNKKPLTETACFQGNCPHWEEDDIVCPSGFWGYRHYIGLPHTAGQHTAPAEIFYKETPEFIMTVSNDKNFVMRAAHEQNLKEIIPNDWWKYANNRKDTLKILKANQPHLVYFYCHGVTTNTGVPGLLVGDDDDRPIFKDNIRAKRIKWENAHPLVFINGCHTTALRPSQAMEFVSGFVETAQAAGVIGTEITIFEPLATSFAEAFFKRFLKGESVGRAIRNSRLELLENRNPLGLVYIPYVMGSLQLVKTN